MSMDWSPLLKDLLSWDPEVRENPESRWFLSPKYPDVRGNGMIISAQCPHIRTTMSVVYTSM